MYALLAQSINNIPHPTMQTYGEILAETQRLNAIHHLLSTGMFGTILEQLTPELMDGVIPVEAAFSYESTEFGRTVFNAARKQQGWHKAFESWLKTPKGTTWFKAVAANQQKLPVSTDPSS